MKGKVNNIITRFSSHSLKFSTHAKKTYLNQLFVDFEHDLKLYIDGIISGQIELKKFCDTSLQGHISHSAWKQIIAKNASEIIRSQICKANAKRYDRYKKIYAKCIKANRHKSFTSKRFAELNLKPIFQSKYFTKPDLKNFTITLDSRVINFQPGDYFDEFIRISLPYFQDGKKLSIKINLPFKYHKHSLKYKSWQRKNSVSLKKVNGQFYLGLFYEKEVPEKRQSGYELGIDQGYKKLISDSNGKFYGTELFHLYQRISNKVQGSKKFQRLLKHRLDETNRIINEFFKENQQLRTLYIEDLKNVKRNTKIYRKTMNKVQRWLYSQVTSKLERFCQENGIQLVKVNPAYTSVTCSSCGTVDKESRFGELFHCQHCGYELDADFNAAVNIYRRGYYDTSQPRNQITYKFL